MYLKSIDGDVLFEYENSTLKILMPSGTRITMPWFDVIRLLTLLTSTAVRQDIEKALNKAEVTVRQELAEEWHAQQGQKAKV